MSFCCLKCRKNVENSKISNGKTMLLSKCSICGDKKSRFVKKQEASGILSSLGLRRPLIKVPLRDDILFWTQL